MEMLDGEPFVRGVISRRCGSGEVVAVNQVMLEALKKLLSQTTVNIDLKCEDSIT